MFGPGLGPGFSGRCDAFGPRLVLGPKAFTLLDGREVEIAVSVAEAERTVKAVLQSDAVLGPDPIGLFLSDLIPDVLVADGEVVSHAPRIGSGKQLLEIDVVG